MGVLPDTVTQRERRITPCPLRRWPPPNQPGLTRECATLVIVDNDDPRILEPGHAPTPFTADEIRSGCPAGRTMKLLVEAAVEPPYHRHIKFIEADDRGATQDLWRTTLDGVTLGGTETVYSTWDELQRHASFRASATAIESESIDLGIGTHTCLRYTVREGNTTHTFWFAPDLPGVPVKFTAHADDRLTYLSVMIANTPR